MRTPAAPGPGAAAAAAAAMLLLLGCGAAPGAVRYSIDCSLDLDSLRLEGVAVVTLSGADLPADDVVFVSTRFGEDHYLELTGAAVGGTDVAIMAGPGGAALTLPPSALGGGELRLEIRFLLAAVPESEGIVLLDDNLRDGVPASWYPRLLEAASPLAHYQVTLTLEGPGRCACAAPSLRVDELGTRRVYRLEHPSSGSLVIAASPIFAQERAAVGACDLGLFVREGSERWGELLLSALAEVYDFYAERIPGFSYQRLDAVLAGEDYDPGQYRPALVVVGGDLDDLGARFGGVFVGNYLRWRASVELARVFWGGSGGIRQPGGAVPWLRDGLALYYAERYSEAALLGGPAFDNIRRFYLSAAASGLDTSLGQTAAEAEEAGLDARSVLARSKGLWVVGMLADALGSRAWRRFVTALVEEPPGGVLTTDRIQELAEAAAGRPLRRFFDDWVRGDARLDYGIGDVRRGDPVSRVLVRAAGAARGPVTLRALFSGGDEVSRVVEVRGRETWVEVSGSGPLRRLELDPERLLPDFNRGDNVRSFGSAAGIELLYAIDRRFDVGEVIFTAPPGPAASPAHPAPPARRDGVREGRFELTITNRGDVPRALGLHLTVRFPGARNRAVTRLYISLAPRETVTLREAIAFPGEGSGLAEVRADYFAVPDREAFDSLDALSRPALTNYYIYLVEDEQTGGGD